MLIIVALTYCTLYCTYTLMVLNTLFFFPINSRKNAYLGKACPTVAHGVVSHDIGEVEYQAERAQDEAENGKTVVGEIKATLLILVKLFDTIKVRNTQDELRQIFKQNDQDAEGSSHVVSILRQRQSKTFLSLDSSKAIPFANDQKGPNDAKSKAGFLYLLESVFSV